MDAQESEERRVTQTEMQRGLGHDMVVAAAGAAAGGIVSPVVSQVTGHLLNRPPKEEPPQVVLPPGVKIEE